MLKIETTFSTIKQRWHPNWTIAYIMILPLIFLLVGLVLYPILWNISISFQSTVRDWLTNYREIISSDLFVQVVQNVIIWVISCVVLDLIVGLSIAVLLNQKVLGMAIFRALILVLPWATPDVVSGVAWKWIYNDLYGVINDILWRFHLISTPIPFLGQINTAMPAVIVANLWKGFSLSAMFYLAGLQTLPEELIDAARVDGAGRLDMFRYVIIPHLRPTIIVTFVLTIILTMNYFPLIYIMTQGGPSESTETFVTWAYRVGFTFLDFPKSATISTISFIVILFFASIYAWRFTSNEDRV
jgi:multiple sugar transport system permease protein